MRPLPKAGFPVEDGAYWGIITNPFHLRECAKPVLNPVHSQPDMVLSVPFLHNSSHQGQAHHCSCHTENQTGSERERHLRDTAQPGGIRVQTKVSETVKLSLFPLHLLNQEGGRGSGLPTAFSDFARTQGDSSPSPTSGGSGMSSCCPTHASSDFLSFLGLCL